MKLQGRWFMRWTALACLTLAACAPVQSAEAVDTLYQVSSLDALMAGNYDGLETAGQALKRGDFGIGTFEALDGEMVMLDGVVYQVKSSGAVEQPGADIRFPFSAVTHFDADFTQKAGPVENYDALKALIDPLIVKQDRFYAIRIDGVFTTAQVRSVPRQEKPYPALSEVTKSQPVFDYENVEGSLVGFWCPDYVGSVNVPGYHLHFISKDRTQGGHLLNVSFADATITLDETRFFEMALGQDGAQGELENAQEAIDQVEK